jgi:hypothetical protein
MDTVLFSTVGATEEYAVHLHAMTDDPAAAMSTGRSQGMNRAFEAIEDMYFSLFAHFETFIVFVATDLARSHRQSFLVAPHIGLEHGEGAPPLAM